MTNSSHVHGAGLVPGVTHRTIEVNGITMHVAEAAPADGVGDAPTVVLVHGCPDLWFGWRHQFKALTDAGCRVIAPDMRGYGGTSAPVGSDAYTQFHLVGDLVGMLDVLEVDQAVVVGHDWGSLVAWHAALLRPDRFHGVVGLSVPYLGRGSMSPVDQMRAMSGDNFNYIVYVQEPGVAEAEWDADPRRLMQTVLSAGRVEVGADGPAARPAVGKDAGFLDSFVHYEDLPTWLSEDELDVYTEAFTTTGFLGGINWYRAMNRDWELMAPFADRTIDVPSLFLVGEHDGMRNFVGPAIDSLADRAPGLVDSVVTPGAHWIQAEHPDIVNQHLIDFIATIGTNQP